MFFARQELPGIAATQTSFITTRQADLDATDPLYPHGSSANRADTFLIGFEARTRFQRAAGKAEKVGDASRSSVEQAIASSYIAEDPVNGIAELLRGEIDPARTRATA